MPSAPAAGLGEFPQAGQGVGEEALPAGAEALAAAGTVPVAEVDVGTHPAALRHQFRLRLRGAGEGLQWWCSRGGVVAECAIMRGMSPQGAWGTAPMEF